MTEPDKPIICPKCGRISRCCLDEFEIGMFRYLHNDGESCLANPGEQPEEKKGGWKWSR